MAGGGEADGAGEFFASCDADVGDLAVGNFGGTAFVEGELAGDLGPVAVDDGLHAGGGAGLFAGFGEEDDVAGEMLVAAVELEHGFDVGGEGAFIVGGTAAVEDFAVEFSGERIDGPVGAVDGNDVLVGEEEDGLLRAGALETGDDAGAPGDRFEDVVGYGFALEDGCDVGGDLGLVAGRVLGVDLDEVGEDGSGFGGGFVGRKDGGGLGAGGGEAGGAAEQDGGGLQLHRWRLRWGGFSMDYTRGGCGSWISGGEAADFDRAVVVGAGEGGVGVGVEDEPCDAERMEAGVAGGVGLGGEVALGVLTLEPLVGELGRDGCFAAVFGEVGDGAAEGGGAEGLGVFAVFVDVLCVEGEEGVGGCVVACPEEGLDPGVWVAVGEPGEFEVFGCGEGLALNVEHCRGESEEDEDGGGCECGAGGGGAGTGAGFEDKLGEDGTEQEGHDDVEQKEDAEGLHARDEVGAAGFVGEEQDDEGGDAADGDVGATEGGGGDVEGGGAGAEAAEESVEDCDGAENAEELEPLPLGEEPVVAGSFGGDDGRGFGGGEMLEDGGEDEGGSGEDGPGEVALAEVGEPQDEDETEGIGGHERVKGCSDDEA